MRRFYFNLLKKLFRSKLIQHRASKRLTQAQMAELLMMDTRSYVDLDHGKHMCSTLTFVLFLLYCCRDPAEFIEEIRLQFEDQKNHVA